MKYGHIFWAIILIAVGSMILLSNFGWFDIRWITLWQLWPLVLVFWGISILPVRDLIKIILLVLALAFTILFINRLKEPGWNIIWDDHSWSWHDETDSDKSDGKEPRKSYNYSTQTLSVPYDTAVPKAVLKMDAAAGKFKIGGETADLILFHKEGDVGDYSLTTEEVNGMKEVTIMLESGERRIRHSVKNSVKINMNQSPIWNLDFDIGAASMEMDLSQYKIDTMNIDAGAASVEIRLGSLNPETYLTYDAGASSFKMKIPKESACQIHSESVLVSREFEGFIKTGDGVYQTKNYPEGINRIIIKIESAVSSLRVDRY
jgi:hypothetical protein